MEKSQNYFIKKANLANSILKIVPFIKMVAIAGNVALGKIKKTSDIDFFIITGKNRLWTVRFLTIILLDLFFLRAKDNHKAGRICLNHFSSDNSAITPKTKYNAFIYSKLKILYQSGKTYEKFIGKNIWIKNYVKIKKNYSVKSKSNFIKNLLENMLSGKFGDKLEKKLYITQVKKIKNNLFFYKANSFLKISREEFCYYLNPK